MPFKIFVGNIVEGSDSEELRTMFEAHGRVTECDIVGNYAFVHMAQESEAVSAIEHLHQATFHGVQIRCELSTKNTQGRKRAREANDEEGGYSGGGGGGRGGRGGGRGGGGRGGGRGRGGDRGGRGGGRGRGSDRFQPYEKERDSFDDKRDPYAARDPLRDPYIRDVLLRDPYVRDLIERELYYRDMLTRGDPYDRERLPPLDSYSEQYARRAEMYSRDTGAERDPYARPPPDYYNRMGAAEGGLKADNGLAAAVRERLAPPQRPAPRPVPPPNQEEYGFGRGGGLLGSRP